MLQADAAATYHETLRRETAIIEVGCWAHARRNFFNALGLDRERALIGIGFIGKLYEAHRAAMNDAGVVDGPERNVNLVTSPNRLQALYPGRFERTELQTIDGLLSCPQLQFLRKH